MKKIKGLVATVVGLMIAGALGVVGLSTGANAAMKISVSPMSTKIVLSPGETYKGSITVMNPVSSEGELEYEVVPGSYSVSGTENSKDSYDRVDVENVTEKNVIKDWITLKNGTGKLKPNESVTVEYQINVPNDAPAGGQYATLLVREKKNVDDNSTSGSNINEVMQMASIIYASVAGTTREEGKVLENKLPSFLLDGTVEATAMVENKGNVHTDAEFILQVFPMGSDEEICVTKSEDSKVIVLPDTKKYHQESCKLPGVGVYRAKQTVRIFGEESVVESNIIYCPIWLMLVIAFVVALIVWIFMTVMKRKK